MLIGAVLIIEQELYAEDEEVGEAELDAWYLRRLDGGLFTLQTVDYVLAWVCMEDDGVCLVYPNVTTKSLISSSQIREHVLQMLTRRGKSLTDVVGVLKIYRDNIGDEAETTPVEEGEDVSPPQREILTGLISFLEGC